jgi:phosphatidylinositol-3-phosphatase
MALLAAIAAATRVGAPRADAGAPPSHATRRHVVVIVLENREYGTVIGNPEAPFINRLARRGALARRYYAVAHPSLPNYLALLGGSTFGVAGNCTDCVARGGNLALQLSRAGVSWRAYMEGMPRPCFRGDSAGQYVKRHDPFMYFPSIAAYPRRCGRVVPSRRLGADLRREALPEFAWIGPGLCHGGHDCGIDVADRYLARLVPRLTKRLGRHGFLVITFDEGTSDLACCGVAGGGRVATILAGPAIRGGAGLERDYTHYSLLATVEDAFGLRRLRHARSAGSLRGAFGNALE